MFHEETGFMEGADMRPYRSDGDVWWTKFSLGVGSYSNLQRNKTKLMLLLIFRKFIDYPKAVFKYCNAT